MYLHWSSSLIHLLAPYAKLYFAQRDCQEKFTITTLEMKHQQSLSCLKRTFCVPKWLILMVGCLSEKENPSLTKVKPPGSFPSYKGWNRYFGKRRLAVFMLQLVDLFVEKWCHKVKPSASFHNLYKLSIFFSRETRIKHTHTYIKGRKWISSKHIYTHTYTYMYRKSRLGCYISSVTSWLCFGLELITSLVRPI